MNSVSPLGNGTEGRARWSLRLFGAFELSPLPAVAKVAIPGKRERVLLAYLALSPNYRQPRRKLVSLLWGDAADETTLDNLRNCLWNLRKALGDTEHRVIASEGEDIVLDAADFEVDALAFRRLSVKSGRPDLEAAAALYIGEFLDGLVIESEEFESWRRAEASRCRDLAIDVLTRRMTQFSECGETERAIEAGERILRLEPLHEAAVRRLMRHYADSGRRGAAIQLYRTFAEALRTELDAQPEAETRVLFAEIARGGEEQTTSPIAADAKPPPSTTMRRPSDAPRALLRPVFRLHAPLAIFAGALIIATALISYRQLAPLDTSQAVVAEGSVSTLHVGAISIAVLPFTNLSGDASQEFFSDGMTEEITSALVRIPDLRVVSRTSAFQFKGAKKDVRAVGQALGATHLIEGSVRKEGNRVRITAQLIQADSGVHVWTQSYDRELTGMLTMQEDIAQAIAAALRIPLGLAPGEHLVSNRTIDAESYQQYIRARTILRSRNQAAAVGDRFAGAVEMLEQVVAHYPDYGPAWGLLAIMPISENRKEVAAQEAIRLDPRSALGYAGLAGIQGRRGNFAAGEDLLKRALALDPNEPEILDGFSNRLAAVGRIKEALIIREKLRTLEPFVPVYNFITASILLIDGQGAAAIPILEALPVAPPRNMVLAHAYAAEGRYGVAADTLLALEGESRILGSVEDAARVIRSAPTKVKAPEALPVLDQGLSFVYLYVGAPDRVLDYQERQVARYPNLGSSEVRYLWSPDFAPVRKTERFKTFIRKMGYVDYWRARGWPDLCRPKGADDFVCV